MPGDDARLHRIEAQITALTAYLDQRFAALEQRMDTLQERFERSETTMLTAFHQHLGRHNAQWTAARILATQALDAIEELRARR